MIARRKQFSFYERVKADRTRKKKRARNLVVKGVLLMVLVVGGASAFILTQTSQDIRQRATQQLKKRILPTEKLSLEMSLIPEQAQTEYQVGDTIYTRVMLDSRVLPKFSKVVIVYDPQQLTQVSAAASLAADPRVSQQLVHAPGQIELVLETTRDSKIEFESNLELLRIQGKIVRPGMLSFEFDPDQTQLINDLSQDVLLEARGLTIYVEDQTP